MPEVLFDKYWIYDHAEPWSMTQRQIKRSSYYTIAHSRYEETARFEGSHDATQCEAHKAMAY